MPAYDYKCFICENIQEEIHSIGLVSNDVNDFDKTLVCKKCGMIDTMKRIFSIPVLAKFSMSSPEEKKNMLKKRSQEHFKKNIEDKFHQLNKKS